MRDTAIACVPLADFLRLAPGVHTAKVGRCAACNGKVAVAPSSAKLIDQGAKPYCASCLPTDRPYELGPPSEDWMNDARDLLDRHKKN